jgi:hypothetical protein
MLNDVSYNEATNKLTFTWNTDAGITADEVALSDILDPYTFEAGAKIAITVDGTKVTIAHTAVDTAESDGTGRKYLTGVTTDGYGHITGFTTASEVDQDLTHDHDNKYKALQELVVDPTANGNSMEFIASISQDEQGVITTTKKTVDAYTKEQIDNISYSLSKNVSKATLYLAYKNVKDEEFLITVELKDLIENVFNNLLSTLRFYEVSFDGNGGGDDGDMPSRIVAGPEYLLPECAYTHPRQCHQQFKGWSLSSDGSETIISANSKYTFKDNDSKLTFYAIWETKSDNLGVKIEDKVYPTCIKEGSQEKTVYCSVCDETISTETLEVPKNPDAHVWDDGEVTKQPEGENAGEKMYTCTACDATKIEEFFSSGSDPESEAQ